MKPSPFLPASQSPSYSYTPRIRRNQNPFTEVSSRGDASPPSFTYSTRSSDEIQKLREDIAKAAAALERKKKVVSTTSNYTSNEADYRASLQAAEDQRRQEMVARNYEAIRVQIGERERQKAVQAQMRQSERIQLEAHQRAVEEDWERQQLHRRQQASSYKEALDLQRQVRKVAQQEDNEDKQLPGNLNLLAFELPEFQSPVYTIKRPKQVATDPLTFHSPQMTRSSSNAYTKKNSGDLATYGRLTLLSPLREPVNNKHAGLSYHDTRRLIQ